MGSSKYDRNYITMISYQGGKITDIPFKDRSEFYKVGLSEYQPQSVSSRLGASLDPADYALPVVPGQELDEELIEPVIKMLKDYSIELAAALKDEGFIIDKDTVELAEPIKSLGIYELVVKLHPEVIATVKLWVVKK